MPKKKAPAPRKKKPQAGGVKKKRGSKRDRRRLANAAVYSRRRETVQKIIAGGIDVDFIDEDWETSPLIGASRSGRIAIMKDLIRAGADVNFTDGKGATALYYTQPDSEAAKLLKEYGAIVLEPDEDKLDEWEKPTEKRRGVISFERYGWTMLVRGGVAEVAEAYAELRQARVWIEDIDNSEVETAVPAFVVFRHRGHTWTAIDFWDGGDFAVMSAEFRRRPRDLETLSARLDTPAIEFSMDDTSGYYGYRFFDGGELIEKLEYVDQVDFVSQRGRDAPKPGNVEEFIDAFFREQDAWFSGHVVMPVTS